ncbi:Uncharacterized protein ALO94_05587 [Pseudomonas syringae pv. spinaceae]|uniref:Uncharacterized protein n=1 Tax=Pseudomonas syringae pv. spinaceae TaxID=264459 RepID=A0A0Q0FUT0_PSESX|nr:Uncharacterized protein ALO94_05587 [Pseudomonas syringae pv. spinaceae]
MLGRNAICHFDGLRHVRHLDQRTTAIDRCFDNGCSRHGRQQTRDARGNLVEEFGVRADQNGLSIFVVLGLGEQVHGDPVRIGLAVAHHQNLGRPGNHVDADLPEHMALGRGDIDIARADDLIDLRYALSAVGQGRHSLRAPNGEHTVNAGDTGCRQHQLVDFATRRRHDHDHLGHPRHFRRNGIHQHRRRVRRLAAGHVQAGSIQRRDFLPQHRAVGLGVAPGVLLLLLVVAAHTLGGFFQCLALNRRNARQRKLQTFAGQDQLSHRSDLQAVEFLSEFNKRCVATLTHGLDDIEHALVDRVVRHTFPAQQMIQMAREIRVSSVESANCSGRGHSGGLNNWRMLRSLKLPSYPRRHLRNLAMTRIAGRNSSLRGGISCGVATPLPCAGCR